MGTLKVSLWLIALLLVLVGCGDSTTSTPTAEVATGVPTFRAVTPEPTPTLLVEVLKPDPDPSGSTLFINARTNRSVGTKMRSFLVTPDGKVKDLKEQNAVEWKAPKPGGIDDRPTVDITRFAPGTILTIRVEATEDDNWNVLATGEFPYPVP